MWRLFAITIVSLLPSACTPQLFPPGTLKDVDQKFDFTSWRRVPSSVQNNHKVQLGGRIVTAHSKDETLTFVAAHLPIVQHPAYGPKETRKSHDVFAILYHGKLDPLFLQPGNRLIVVGYTGPSILVEVDDVLRSLPAITAQCIHIWQTGNSDIADFHASGAGHVVLKEDTYCGDESPWSPLGIF
jgi:starvation-inducible outer membrane lipoprotein